MEYYLAIKKNEILPCPTTWMEVECITPSEISQSETDKYHTTSLICGIQETKQMDVVEGKGKEGKNTRGTHKRLSNTQKQLRITRGRSTGGWTKRVMDIKEDTCWDEYTWVLQRSDGSLNCAPESIVTLYVT